MNNDVNSSSELLLEWVNVCSAAIDDYLDLTSPMLLEAPQIAPEAQWVLKHLAISCNLTSISALTLIGNSQFWSSEILLRAVFEGTFKYAFLCIGDEGDRKSKTDEYLNQLPEIATIKEQQRLRDLFASVDNPTGDEWTILRKVLIDDGELESLKAKFPRETRQRLEQKWSFIEIARKLASSDVGVPQLDPINKLIVYSYGIASHLIHQDGDAIKLIWDRNLKAQDNRESTEIAHAARQLNDLLIMASFRTIMTFKLYRKEISPVMELYESHLPFLNQLTHVRQIWEKTCES
jgi:hypothetical protein